MRGKLIISQQNGMTHWVSFIIFVFMPHSWHIVPKFARLRPPLIISFSPSSWNAQQVNWSVLVRSSQQQHQRSTNQSSPTSAASIHSIYFDGVVRWTEVWLGICSWKNEPPPPPPPPPPPSFISPYPLHSCLHSSLVRSGAKVHNGNGKFAKK